MSDSCYKVVTTRNNNAGCYSVEITYSHKESGYRTLVFYPDDMYPPSYPAEYPFDHHFDENPDGDYLDDYVYEEYTDDYIYEDYSIDDSYDSGSYYENYPDDSYPDDSIPVPYYYYGMKKKYPEEEEVILDSTIIKIYGVVKHSIGRLLINCARVTPTDDPYVPLETNELVEVTFIPGANGGIGKITHETTVRVFENH